ncbi:hypothetical protein EDF77_2958 [Stenotrophomonas maltophilia]|jgi:hypothetical protein|nr:hypothetical protein [Stenotrophomonas chelatiphaga]MDR6095871.1 hypothetical protein [Stenotrophomonas sp. SORGH_AS_0321]ROQ39135.1 hypothetical protein EDF77_2958 [Stenotrophomonas maltophilia]
MQSGHEPKQADIHGPVWNAGRNVALCADRAFLPPTDAPCRQAGAFVFLLKEVHHV